MKFLFYLGLFVMVALSLAAGGAKVVAMEQEVELFRDARIDPSWLLPLGVLQIVGGLLAALFRTRRAATVVVALGFLISTFVIFRTGNSEFAVVSLTPVVLCILIFWRSNRLDHAA